MRAALYTVGQVLALACLVAGVGLLAGWEWALTLGGALAFVFLVLMEGAPWLIPAAPIERED